MLESDPPVPIHKCSKDFIKSEEMLKSITFNKLDVYVSANKKAKRLLQYKLEFCCSINRESRVDPKSCLKVGKCLCRLIFRKYYDSEIMEVIYIDQHSHEIGEANLKHTRLSFAFREVVRQMFRDGKSTKAVKKWIYCHGSEREYVVSNKDLSYLKKSAELEEYAYHVNDKI